MQGFNFGLRRPSVADSMDDHESRYISGSTYSGNPNESRASSAAAQLTPMATQGPFHGNQPRYNPSNQEHPRSSALLNIDDPVAMHLLMETAISDSKEYEILSFEEVEQLKKDRAVLRSRLDAARRKLALETKLRDAASSLNRLYSTKGRPPSGEFKPDAIGLSPPTRNKRRSFLGGSKSGEHDAYRQADNEFVASSRKVEEYTQEVTALESRLQNYDSRILQHTAGILQMTHRGLKKNIKKNQLPHSPGGISSQDRSGTRMDGIDEFDERSLYQVPDYVTDFGLTIGKTSKEASSLQEMSKRLDDVSSRLHHMIHQSGPQEHFDPPPQPTDEHISGDLSAQVKAQIGYMSQGLDAMEAHHVKTVADAQKTVFDSEDQLEDVNVRLHNMLVRTNSVSKSPVLPEDEPRGKDLQTQLQFSATVLDRLHRRIETLVEQKDILTRQIQQQRELNSKSDAERDAKIHELNDQLSAAQKKAALNERDVYQHQDQLNLMMEQLDKARQHNVLLEQKTVPTDVLESERSARQKSDQELENFRNAFRDLEAHHEGAQTDLSRARAELEGLKQKIVPTELLESEKSARQKSVQELEDARYAYKDLEAHHEGAQTDLSRARAELEELKQMESQFVQVQTELTMVKAELDAAYGSRAQRAADVSSNPEVQKEIENLKRELKETIEDYEVMTQQSIEAEKERDRYEEKIDYLEHHCDGLESQLSEERVKWMGVKSSAPNETTSTMVLKNEFKKMMRETKAEQIKMYKVSRAWENDALSLTSSRLNRKNAAD